eukprot:1186612-Prorocentrum_minimum.AAC.4
MSVKSESISGPIPFLVRSRTDSRGHALNPSRLSLPLSLLPAGTRVPHGRQALVKPLYHWRIKSSPQIVTDAENVPEMRIAR